MIGPRIGHFVAIGADCSGLVLLATRHYRNLMFHHHPTQKNGCPVGESAVDALP